MPTEPLIVEPAPPAPDSPGSDPVLENRLLHLALQQMPHGMCMFDGQDRLLLANDHYARIWALPPDLLRPGTAFAEIMQHTRGREVACAGTAPPAPAGSLGVRRREWLLDDGRTIDVVVTRLADGSCVAVHEDITAKRRSEQEIAFLARHDPLTRLPNRGALREQFAHMLSRHARGEPLAVLCLDLDRFKAVNDLFGHPAGDALLCQVADRLRACARETDLIFRLGGDEFALLQCGTPQPCSATALARRMVATLAQPYDLDGHLASVGTSIGIAVAPDDGLDPDTLLKNADRALYQAKAGGRGTFLLASQLPLRD
jgi:diguanylate cyclase (GGDEF)-like protein